MCDTSKQTMFICKQCLQFRYIIKNIELHISDLYNVNANLHIIKNATENIDPQQRRDVSLGVKMIFKKK